MPSHVLRTAWLSLGASDARTCHEKPLFLVKGWHYDVGQAICAPMQAVLPHPSDRTARGCLMAFSPPSNWSFVALILAFILARTLAQMLAVGPSWTHRLIQAYVYIFQGTPILIQLWLMYYGLAQFEWIRESVAWTLLGSGWWVGLIVLTLNSAAYQTNILIGGIQNLPSGQLEGAQSLGLSQTHTYRQILFPQALRASWPALANEGILLLKASALVSTITVLDLDGAREDSIFSKLRFVGLRGSRISLYRTDRSHDPHCLPDPEILVSGVTSRPLVSRHLAISR